MRFAKTAAVLCVVAASFLAVSATPREANAQTSSLYVTTYKVQVEYWFFDTDYSFWYTVFESNNLQEAQLFYELLLIAKENHQLNEVVPASYGRYIAIDVRMITEHRRRELLYPRYADLQPVNSATLIGK